MHMKMNRATRPGYPLAAFCLLAFVAEPALAQSTTTVTCTPMVYAFRHAEDSDAMTYPNTLTPTGLRHADLYVSMLDGINASLGINASPGSNHCPVTKVYAINLKMANGDGNTNNPYLTAKPLAKSRMADANPIETVGGYALLEFLGNDAPDPLKNTLSNPYTASYTKPEATALRTTLIATAKTQTTITTPTTTTTTTYTGQSSAIFWTSAGLNILGGAIIGRVSKVPQKSFGTAVFSAFTSSQLGTPQRNAAYIFRYNGSSFDDVPKFDQYVQCYNWTLYDPSASAGDFKSNYWCGKKGWADLGGAPSNTTGKSKISDADLGCVRAKICDTDKLTAGSANAAYYGSCPKAPLEVKAVPGSC